jgi:hypothetical protein
MPISMANRSALINQENSSQLGQPQPIEKEDV